jgi:hypothetical protein
MHHLMLIKVGSGVAVVVFNATFKNISVISWQSVLLVGETGVPGENHPPVVSHWSYLLFPNAEWLAQSAEKDNFVIFRLNYDLLNLR